MSNIPSFVVPSSSRNLMRNIKEFAPVDINNYIPGSSFARSLGGSLIKNTFETNFQINLGKSRNTNYNKNSNLGSSSNDDDGPGKGSGGSGSNGNRPHKSKDANPNRGFYQYKEPSTTKINFTSGIKSGTLVNRRQVVSAFQYSSLFVLNGSFFNDTLKNRFFIDIIEKDIYREYQRLIQRRVNINSAKLLDNKMFFKYFCSVSSALQLYYQVESILAFTSDPTKYNSGLTSIRNKFSPEILSQHERLRRSLINQPIPQNLIKFIDYMYSNFSFSRHPNSTIYRLGFRSTLIDTSEQTLTPDYYDVIIDEMFECNEVMALIAKAVPEMVITSLNKVSSEVIYDENFLTFWSNSCITRVNSPNKDLLSYSRVVFDRESEFPYFQYTDEDLDGLFYGLSSYLNAKTDLNEPGLWSPITNAKSLNTADVEQQCSLLCHCDEYNGLTVISSEITARQSGIFNCFYYTESDGWRSIDGIDPRMKLVQINSLNNLNSCVSESVSLLIGV